MFKHRLIQIALATITAFSAAPSFAAAPLCEYIFEGPKLQQRTIVDFGIRGTKNLEQTPPELANYAAIKKDLWETLAKLPLKKRTEIEHTLAAVEFFDYAHMATKLLGNFFEGKKESIDFTKLYDKFETVDGAPFLGYLSTRDNYLRVEKPSVTPHLLKNIHSRVMQNGVEGVTSQQLGVWRNAHWLGNASGANAVKRQEAQQMQENPYLLFVEKDSYFYDKAPALKNLQIWGRHKNTTLKAADELVIEGVIHYPHVLTTKTETIEIIKNSHPVIYKQIMDFRDYSKMQVSPTPKLEQSFTTALVEERFARFNTHRAALGPVKMGVNEARYIDLVADFQRDLVAIHPVLNGNGRTTRLLMNYLLTKEGLPPVRLVDPFLDVQVSQKEWREYVHKGVLNSAQLQADIAFRVKNNLDIGNSTELLYPGLPERIAISLKREGSTKEVPNHEYVKLETEQFSAFLKTVIQGDPNILRDIINQPRESMARMADLFIEYHRSKTVRYIHGKDGERIVTLRLIEPDFIEQFSVIKSGSLNQWNAKIDSWYDRSMLIWRGLSNSKQQTSQTEILNLFKKPSSHLASNNVLSQIARGVDIVKAAKENFETYNKEAINGEVVEMANDHHKTGPRYRQSYGFSTSKREVVGKAFAMGAMVHAEYGKQNDPAVQANIKSRVNVATYRALKDVDLGRLRVFDPEFAYIYGRQAEIMGIGATDPDAVMLVQTINAKGQVMETFLRNIEKPNEVLIIEGRYVPSEGALAPERIKQRITIHPATL